MYHIRCSLFFKFERFISNKNQFELFEQVACRSVLVIMTFFHDLVFIGAIMMSYNLFNFITALFCDSRTDVGKKISQKEKKLQLSNSF